MNEKQDHYKFITANNSPPPSAACKRFYEPKVSFNLQPKIHYLFVWDFAYRQARKGHWTQLTADRESGQLD